MWLKEVQVEQRKTLCGCAVSVIDGLKTTPTKQRSWGYTVEYIKLIRNNYEEDRKIRITI
jgi:hypothetical protein